MERLGAEAPEPTRSGTVRILLVEQDADRADLLLRRLSERPALLFDVVHVERASAALMRISRERFDAVLLHLAPHDGEDLEPLRILTEGGVCERCPIVVVTHGHDDELAAAAIQNGALDSIVETELSPRLLARTLRAAIDRHRIERELRNARERAQRLATHCSLTGLPNRYLLEDRLAWALAAAVRDDMHLAVLAVDLDRFKLVNDTLGHHAADEVLRTVARRLIGSVRSSDSTARLAADEFAIVLRNIARPEDAGRVAEHVLQRLSEPMVLEGRELYVGASIGIAIYPEDGRAPEDLLRSADAAMNRAKAAGGGAFHFYADDLDRSSSMRLLRQVELQRAVAREEFLLHYQPKVCGKSGAILGVEALIRWMHPEQGMVPPAEFIPLAEESALIGPIGEWALREACRQQRRWRDEGLPAVPVAVNVSPRQFWRGDFYRFVARTLAEEKVDPSSLELEITESCLLLDTAEAVRILHQVRGLGVRMSLDDFGTGFSSLALIKDLPLDCLKIDRAFVKDLPGDEREALIASIIVMLGQGLGLETVAEGVETVEQRDILLEHGCEAMQGFLFSAPLAAEDVAVLLAEGRIVPKG